MAKIAAKHRPKPEHAKGADVTVPDLRFHGVVLGQHVSYRVRRGDAEILVGDGEDVDGIDTTPLDTHVSYLVERQWDGAPIWIDASRIIGGHNTTMRDPSLSPSGQ